MHLCGKRYVDRPESETMVKVYSNQPSVSLYVNGKLFSEQRGAQGIYFSVPLGRGRNPAGGSLRRADGQRCAPAGGRA